jgi:hypothetical protein
MSFEFENVNHSFQEVSQDPELQHRSQSDSSGELSDSELEAVAGGCNTEDKDDGWLENLGARLDRGIDRGIKRVKDLWS